MKQISYTSDETYFTAGKDIEDARYRAREGDASSTTPQGAWNLLGYWDREERSEEFEVFEFHVTEKITKVEPPYSA